MKGCTSGISSNRLTSGAFLEEPVGRGWEESGGEGWGPRGLSQFPLWASSPPCPHKGAPLCGDCVETLVGGSSVWLCGGEGCTHLWVQGHQALLWDLGIQGALEPQGDQWSLGGLGGPGGQQDPVAQWSLVLGASSGVRPAARFALLENKDQTCVT